MNYVPLRLPRAQMLLLLIGLLMMLLSDLCTRETQCTTRYVVINIDNKDNEGGTTPRKTVDQSTHYNCIYTNWRLVDYYTMILHDSSSGLKMNIDRDMISRILKSRYILSIVPG
jgi:hypothetical protein